MGGSWGGVLGMRHPSFQNHEESWRNDGTSRKRTGNDGTCATNIGSSRNDRK